MVTERTTGTPAPRSSAASPRCCAAASSWTWSRPSRPRSPKMPARSAVMALERVPSDIRRDGGVARMSDPSMIEGIQKQVTIPVMAKCRIGHFAEAQVLQSLGVDYVDESEVLSPADEAYHVDKWAFTVPFVCGATNLGEALRRIGEGARSSVRRAKPAPATSSRPCATSAPSSATSTRSRAPGPKSSTAGPPSCGRRSSWCRRSRERGELPVPLFCAGGIATPADAALVMQLGAQSVFVGSGIFKSADPPKRAPRSSRPPRTTPTPTSWPRCRGASVTRCRVSRWTRSR